MTATKQETGSLSEADIKRFGEKYLKNDVTGCWVWSAAVMTTGLPYGKFTFMRRTETEVKNVTKPAHHAAFWIANGRWPATGMVLMHSCDRPGCVNPEHLAEGTPKQNSADMTSKSRQAKGTRHWKNKLTESQVLEIRRAFDSGEPIGAIGERFDTNEGNVWFIGHRKTWKHLKES
jgi:hypothetical protein